MRYLQEQNNKNACRGMSNTFGDGHTSRGHIDLGHILGASGDSNPKISAKLGVAGKLLTNVKQNNFFTLNKGIKEQKQKTHRVYHMNLIKTLNNLTNWHLREKARFIPP